MVIQFRIYFCLLVTAFLISCTQAIPEITSLGSVQFMSSKSPSPFDQENTGEYLTFSGQCVSLVKKFQFRLDNHAWNDVSITAPTPDAGETAPASTYDVDCANGQYDFYLFMSQIDSYVSTHIGGIPSDYDPARVEIQGLTEDDVVVPGTIIFQRPLATGLRIEPSNYTNSAPWWLGTLETNQMIRFKVTLIDALGRETRRFSAESDLNLTLTTGLISGASAATGEAYLHNGTNCLATPQTTFTFVAGSGEDSIDICFNALAVSAGATIQFVIGAPGFASQVKQFTILSPYQVFNSLVAGNGYQQRLPQTLIRGANYKFITDLIPLDHGSGQQVLGFEGTHRVNSSSSFVDFLRGSRLYDCGATGIKNSQIECNTGFFKAMPFYMTVQSGYPASSLNLSLSSAPLAPCPTCRIEVPPSDFAISGYQANNWYFNVVSGSTQYAQPRFEFHDRIQDGFCHQISLSLANSDGNTIPAKSSINDFTPLLTLETAITGVHFYQNSGCTTIVEKGPDYIVQKIIPASNGQFYVIGSFTYYNDQYRNQIALINEDGSLDMDFNPASFANTVHDLLPLDDGRVLIVGDFSGGIKLLSENGQEDLSFNFSLNGAAHSLAKVTADANTDHFYVAGSFTEIITTPTNLTRDKLFKLIRSTDPTTGVETFSVTSNTLALSGTFISRLLVHDNYLYIVGNFATPAADLVRMDLSTWIIDPTWPVIKTGFSSDINTLAIDPIYSRLLVGGNFTTALGEARSYFAAITTTGGTLHNYITNPLFNGAIYDIEVRGNNVYVAGAFTTVNGSADHNKVAKYTMISSNLIIDPSWRPSANNAFISSLGYSNSGLLIGGDFTLVNAESYNFLNKVSLTNASNTQFNNNAQNKITMGFKRFDLIKPIYIRSSMGHDGDIPITINDGTQNFNFNVQTDD